MEQKLLISLAKPDESIREHTDKLEKEAKRIYKLGYISKEIYDLLSIVCEYHDYGKLNKQFQKRIKYNTKFSEEREVPHNVLSILFVPDSVFQNQKDYYIALMAIAHHHRLRRNLYEIVSEQTELIVDNINEYMDMITPINKIKRRKLYYEISDLINKKDTRAIIIKGLLHKCDYSASAGIPCEYKNDFLTNSLWNLLKKWNRDTSQKIDWKEMQKFCIQNTDNNIIVTAPTGMGKTEAGLLWIGDNKGFFILPLRTAINAMYDRIAEDILDNENIQEKLALLHSDMKAYYLYDDKEIENINQYIECTSQMSLPLTISTMDQLFDFVFQYPGYEYKLVQLSYSKIVIDEIQMYDTTLLAFLIYGIERIHQIGGKIAILTATLPPFVEDEICKALHGDFIRKDYSEFGQVRHNLSVLKKQIDSNDIRDKYQQLVESDNSAKILVVCNSIENAQDVYKELSDLNVELLHSKYIKKHRKEKEREILKCGRTYDCNGNIDKNQKIWITTSLVEASLDIDFDYLFTELNNVFSLFQRMGRCNRKGIKSNFKLEPNCYVYTEPRGSVKKYLQKSHIFKYSVEAAKDINGIITEEKKKTIIDKYFSVERIRDCEYAEEYYKVKNLIEECPPYENDKATKLRDIATVDIIPLIIYQNKEFYNIICDIKEKLDDRHVSQLDRVKLIADLKEYCVSIQCYEEKMCDGIHETISIGKGFKINIVDCDYKNDLGFVKNSRNSKNYENDRLKQGGIFIE